VGQSAGNADPTYAHLIRTTYQYDLLGRMTGQTEAANDATVRRLSTFRYDALDNRIEEIYG